MNTKPRFSSTRICAFNTKVMTKYPAFALKFPVGTVKLALPCEDQCLQIRSLQTYKRFTLFN